MQMTRPFCQDDDVPGAWMRGGVRRGGAGRVRDGVTRACALAMLSCLAQPARAQGVCAKLDAPFWLVNATRFFQSSGTAPRVSAASVERHAIDRRVLRRVPTGYRLEIRRFRLGITDLPSTIVVEYGPTGAVSRISGEAEVLAKDVAPLPMKGCGELVPGATLPDLGGRSDTLRSPVQRSVTRSVPAKPVQVGTIDTLGGRLAVLEARRYVTDTARGDFTRQQPNKPAELLHPWTVMSGDEVERQYVRAVDGMVLFRERVRRLAGRGWVPPHDVKDTVAVRVESATVERLVDSATADGVLAFSRRGERSVSATNRDTVAMHYREWQGDTLVLRQFRRSGWRDEFRTVWRDSQLVSAVLIEPGTATQPPGPVRRAFTVTKGFLADAGSREAQVATPAYPWAIALDGYEDALVPALMAVPADSQSHRFSMYGIQSDKGVWLHWSVSVLRRGSVRVARFTTLQQQWVGTVIFTNTGELLLVNLGGQAGVTRVPAAGTRLQVLLEQQRGTISREDMVPAGAAPSGGAKAPTVP